MKPYDTALTNPGFNLLPSSRLRGEPVLVNGRVLAQCCPQNRHVAIRALPQIEERRIGFAAVVAFAEGGVGTRQSDECE